MNLVVKAVRIFSALLRDDILDGEFLSWDADLEKLSFEFVKLPLKPEVDGWVSFEVMSPYDFLLSLRDIFELKIN